MIRVACIVLSLGIGALCVEPPNIPTDNLPANLIVEQVPLGLATIAEQERPRAERVALGRQLFFDPILSADKTIACASCHRPDHGFASNEALPKGVGNKVGIRRAPTLLNRAFAKALFWDGRS